MPCRESDRTQWNHANPVLEMSDVPRAIAYYRDVWGLTPAWMWEERIGGVHGEHSSIEIYLSQSDSPSPSRLAVFVDDADAAYERYRAAGAEMAEEIKPEPWGLRGFTVRDLDGNLIGVAHEVHSPLGRSEYHDLTVSPAWGFAAGPRSAMPWRGGGLAGRAQRPPPPERGDDAPKSAGGHRCEDQQRPREG